MNDWKIQQNRITMVHRFSIAIFNKTTIISQIKSKPHLNGSGNKSKTPNRQNDIAWCLKKSRFFFKKFIFILLSLNFILTFCSKNWNFVFVFFPLLNTGGWLSSGFYFFRRLLPINNGYLICCRIKNFFHVISFFISEKTFQNYLVFLCFVFVVALYLKLNFILHRNGQKFFFCIIVIYLKWTSSFSFH